MTFYCLNNMSCCIKEEKIKVEKNIMDFLKLKKVEKDNEIEELKRLAYMHYQFEIEQFYFLNNMESPLNKRRSFLKYTEVDSLLNNHINFILTNKENLKIKHDSLNHNPSNLDQMNYYKLILCSYYLSFCWYIPLNQLYNYFCFSTNENKNISIDVFIGKIRKLYDLDNDKQFKLFETEIINKFKN